MLSVVNEDIDRREVFGRVEREPTGDPERIFVGLSEGDFSLTLDGLLDVLEGDEVSVQLAAGVGALDGADYAHGDKLASLRQGARRSVYLRQMLHTGFAPAPAGGCLTWTAEAERARSAAAEKVNFIWACS